MGAFDGYYLYCDLDGTLFDDEKRVSTENRTAIETFVSKGGRFGVATGRSPAIIGEIERTLPVNAPCILLNGAGLYDLTQKRFLAAHHLNRASMERMADLIVSVRGNACVQIFTETSIYEINESQRDDPQTVIERLPIITTTLEQITEPALKMLIAHTGEHLDAIHAAVQQDEAYSHFSVFRTADWYLEFVPAGVHKGSALLDVRDRCGNVQKILAIGDYNNDLEMVTLADIGAAPANAIKEVKNAADILLSRTNNESCVAEFLHRALGI